ncbi:imidazolonepropionase-like domain-containing protein [Streptomyces sp. NPDC050433]|uniref:imidazolonepropionase-like domain-containing protein n=1 Tax=unclassified Streptomyces TaxID=2593676 RepID=UPI00343E56B2
MPLTIHRADLLLPGAGRAPLPGGAVLVAGDAIGAVGPYEELAAAHPAARVRQWPGVLTPGLCNPYGPELLERAYHPDPREADELGTEPLTGAALAALEMTETRWGASARRGVRRLLAHGTVAVAGPLRREAVADAVARSSLCRRERFGDPPGPPTLDPLAGGRPVEEAFVPPTLDFAGRQADFAVFAVDGPADGDPYAALARAGAVSCVATVLGGRLVHRRA